jgi:hypothetical protein
MLDKIIKKELGLEVVKEYRFHPKRRWKFDYCITSHMIAIEVEGGVYSNGRHTRGSGFIGDMEKYNTATSMGWRLVRILPGKYADALRFVEQILETDKQEAAKLQDEYTKNIALIKHLTQDGK